MNTVETVQPAAMSGDAGPNVAGIVQKVKSLQLAQANLKDCKGSASYVAIEQEPASLRQQIAASKSVPRQIATLTKVLAKKQARMSAVSAQMDRLQNELTALQAEVNDMATNKRQLEMQQAGNAQSDNLVSLVTTLGPLTQQLIAAGSLEDPVQAREAVRSIANQAAQMVNSIQASAHIMNAAGAPQGQPASNAVQPQQWGGQGVPQVLQQPCTPNPRDYQVPPCSTPEPVQAPPARAVPVHEVEDDDDFEDPAMDMTDEQIAAGLSATAATSQKHRHVMKPFKSAKPKKVQLAKRGGESDEAPDEVELLSDASAVASAAGSLTPRGAPQCG